MITFLPSILVFPSVAALSTAEACYTTLGTIEDTMDLLAALCLVNLWATRVVSLRPATYVWTMA